MSDWFFGFSSQVQTAEHAPSVGFDNVAQYWIGRSCGCKMRTLETDVPVNNYGIVVYPGVRFAEVADETQHIKHINTKNGPLTICSNLTYKKRG